MAGYTLNVNGKKHAVTASSADMPLLWALRDILGLTGTKYGCGIEQCSACAVLINGQVEKSCDMSVSEASRSKITTIEGLSALNDKLQAAWIAEQVPQCGYCQSGMLMAAASLLKQSPRPTDAQIDGAMRNICACGTYPRVRKAIKRAAGIA
ncbi:MAG: (2Fe-2S)-binding protein [Actinomycetes bacterium]